MELHKIVGAEKTAVSQAVEAPLPAISMKEFQLGQRRCTAFPTNTKKNKNNLNTYTMHSTYLDVDVAAHDLLDGALVSAGLGSLHGCDARGGAVLQCK